jgi:pimeloyl-ACP methyl ester carboxylesterase
MDADQLQLYAELCRIAYESPDIAIAVYTDLGYKAKVLAQPAPLEQVYVLRHGTELLIVLAGTDQLRDWIANGLSIPGWYVHPGYSEIASALIDSVRAEYKASGLQQLTLLGHSKGGAVAAVLADYLFDLTTNVVTFGAPRIGSQSYANTYEHKRYTRVVHPLDIVARLPMHLLGYRHCGQPVVWNGETYDSHISAWTKAQRLHPTIKLLLNPFATIKAHFSYWQSHD